MEPNTQSWIFISVFYRQSNWHHLLNASREILELPSVRKEITDFRLFINTDRGESIRLALKLRQSANSEISHIVTRSINKFLKANPTETRPVTLPINGFFTDFENNVIKYNLFNDRFIMTCQLATFQIFISKLLLRFFEDHPVDEEGLFTLLIYLQKSILNGLCSKQKEKVDVIVEVYQQVRRDGMKIDHEVLLQADRSKRDSSTDSFDRIPDIDTILSKLEIAVENYQKEKPGKARCFLILLCVIHHQLGKPDDSAFLEALQYLYTDCTDVKEFSNETQANKQILIR